ncbi:NAD(P)-dependent oxidoreductase [Ideonella sp. BN130291]|uniref:NAD(P)-dependent oxidoreductase n=1 Tax=Ideonella sp. BN130291 TaxID=3112940 RepID=UPI002E26FF04|nr:NAD(P)-dependent oxidoreductase [Ideonella sp. BN130291]
MKVALIGSTGFVGSALLQELLQRGHTVTALVRQPGKLAAQDRLHPVQADAQDAAQVAQAVEGHEAVISAYNPGWSAPDLYDSFLRGSAAITLGVKRAGVKRLLVVGGAGSLYVAPGLQLVDTPDFPKHVPPEVVPGARAARDALTAIAQETELDWTFVSPPALLQPGQRTGQYRLGGDQLLMNGAQPAGISVQDLAVAIVDELETPRHSRRRFTVAN